MGRKKAVASGDGQAKDDAPDGSVNAAMSLPSLPLLSSTGPAALTSPITVPSLNAASLLSSLGAAGSASSAGSHINLGPIIGAPVLSDLQRAGSVALAFRKREADGQASTAAVPKLALPVFQTLSGERGAGDAAPKAALPVPGAGGASLLASVGGLGVGGAGASGLNLAALAGLNPLAAATAFGNPAMKQMAALAALSPDLLGMGIGAQKAAEPEQPQKKEDESKDRLGVSYLNDPDILELFDHFQIDNRHMMRFCRAMQRREERHGSFANDMLKVWELCEQARNPEAMLVSKFHELEQDTFIGMTAPDKPLLELQKKFNLDKEALSKLTDVMAKHGKDRRAEYLEQLDGHLATSSKPSAMVMMCLKKIAENQDLGKPGRIAPGSYAARHGGGDGKGDKGGGRGGRSRSRGRGRRSPDRDRGGRYEDRRRGSPDRRRDRDDDRRDRDYGRGGGGRGRDDHDRDRRDDRRDYDRDRRDDRRGGGGGGGDGGAEQGDL